MDISEERLENWNKNFEKQALIIGQLLQRIIKLEQDIEELRLKIT